MRLTLFLAAFASFIATPAMSQAATLTTSGQTLTGATGLAISGLTGTYDVTFVDGTCDQVFGDCSNPANFGDINTSALALNAAGALIALIDTDSTFDQLPEYTLGCGYNTPQCLAIIPYASSDGYVSGGLAVNAKGAFAFDGVGTTSIYGAANTSNISDVVYAKFTASGSIVGSVPGAVPEPATWAMMLIGFGAVGYGLRRQRKSGLAKTQIV